MSRKAIDFDYRPHGYFKPQRLEKHLLSKVKGAVLKRRMEALLSEGRQAELLQELGAATSAENNKVLEAIHPMFMGGNYLPDTEHGEVEIARIRIESTTYDVTSVYGG